MHSFISKGNVFIVLLISGWFLSHGVIHYHSQCYLFYVNEIIKWLKLWYLFRGLLGFLISIRLQRNIYCYWEHTVRVSSVKAFSVVAQAHSLKPLDLSHSAKQAQAHIDIKTCSLMALQSNSIKCLGSRSAVLKGVLSYPVLSMLQIYACLPMR